VKSTAVTVFLLLVFALSTFADIVDVQRELESVSRVPVSEWRYSTNDAPGAENPSFDDSNWKLGSPEFEWGWEPTAWLRTVVVIPDKIGGFPISGGSVTIRVGIDDDGIIYINGKEADRFHWDKGRAVLTENASPGQKFQVAVKGLNAIGPGRLLFAFLEFECLDDIRKPTVDYLDDIAAAQIMFPESKDILNESAAVIDLQAIKTGNRPQYLESIARASQKLEPLRNKAKELTCNLVGHAHIDMNWLWLWPETVDVCKNTFSTVLKLMEEYPQFRFSQSQASTYTAVEDAAPEVFEGIRQRVKEGRWEITGSMWTEGDLNMASGEAIVRQILYAKQYFKDKFGVEPKICWCPDTFGHPWTIPQILAKSDIRWYYFMRCGKNVPVFWWESPDGSRVLAFNDDNYNGDINQNMASEAAKLSHEYGLRNNLVVYGVGDHGGGPTREQINNALELQNRKLFPTVKFSSAEEFFRAIEPSAKNLPVINGELNFEFRGCYTTHGDIKKMNRTLENLLPTAEAFSAVSSLMGTQYPAEDFRSAWQSTSFNQFHDILCGSAIHESYEYSKRLYEKASKKSAEALNNALQSIIKQIDTSGSGIPVVVFNPLAWTRTDVVVVDSPFDPEEISSEYIMVTDGKHNYPAQQLADKLVFTAHDVPGIGYKVFWLKRTKSPIKSNTSGRQNTIENEFFIVKVNPETGAISSIYDKKSKREVLPAGKEASKLEMLLEEPHGMSAWEIGKVKPSSQPIAFKETECLEKGPVRASIRSEHEYGDSTFTQDIMLHEGVPRIDIRLTADWQETGNSKKDAPFLKVAFPASISAQKASFEIPFGSIERPANGDEVPAQKWTDISDDTYGLAVLNDCKYGYDVKDGTIRLSLLRASYEPDPTPDIGVHEIGYSIYPHSGTGQSAGVTRRGYEFNNPLIAIVCSAQKGRLPSSRAFISVKQQNVAVTALKRAENGDGLIIRLYETDGKPTTANITTTLPAKYAVETNLMERKIGNAKPVSKEFSVTLGKYEIKTLKLVF